MTQKHALDQRTSYEDEGICLNVKSAPKPPIVINFMAGPGAGKSTCAAGLFFIMKNLGINVELVTEYAKDITWEKRTMVHQAKILGEQHDRLNKLRGQVDVIITDGPLFHGIVYARDSIKAGEITETMGSLYKDIVVEMCKSFRNVNVFIQRSPTRTYIGSGRNHTQKEAEEKDREIFSALHEVYVPIFPCEVYLTYNYEDFVNRILLDGKALVKELIGS